jgi:hypothetical protein
MLDLVKLAPAECPRCKSGRTWLQPKTAEIHEASATLYHCCGDGQKLTARVIASTEADAVEKWNGGSFDWVTW